ncbi:MAG: type II toxin-antitoxin system VapC family toxin [Sciscionella sp.]|nr:type II toxin-antitoxin system VapC family toxin [Sciscionella sp.]
MASETVVDASALGLGLISKNQPAKELLSRFRRMECHAPHLVDAEFGNVLRRHIRRGLLTAEQAHTALRTAQQLIGHRYPHFGPLSEVAWRLRDNLSFYDALYVGLAARLGLTLITADKRLANAPELPCAVELVA